MRIGNTDNDRPATARSMMMNAGTTDRYVNATACGLGTVKSTTVRTDTDAGLGIVLGRATATQTTARRVERNARASTFPVEQYTVEHGFAIRSYHTNAAASAAVLTLVTLSQNAIFILGDIL